MRLPGRKEWSPGVCIKEIAPRSYLVNVQGRKYRRNRRQILLTDERLPKESSDEQQENASEGISESQESSLPVEELLADRFTGYHPSSSIQLRRSTRDRRPPSRYGIDDRETFVLLELYIYIFSL